MRPVTLGVLCLALVLSATVITSVRSAVPAPDQLRQWNPSESWPGDTQYDPRLERAVTFWGAGIPLAEAFRKVEEQTGVTIEVRPEGTARVCVNLYLNPDRPPSLRAVMAQLMWALDGTFSYEDDGGEIRYSLLASMLGEGDVIGALERQAQADHEEEAKATAVPWEEIQRVQEELRKALLLSREEAIKQYRDRDECVLWDVIDPARRALTELYLSWPVVLNEGSAAPAVSQRYSSLSPEQQRAVLAAAQYGFEEWQKQDAKSGQAPPISGDPAAWLASDPLVSLALGSSYGDASVAGVAQVMQESGVWGPGIRLPRLQVGGRLESFDYVELRRLLGDIKTPEDEKRIREEYQRRANAEETEPPAFVVARKRHEQLSAEMEQSLNSVQVVPNLKGMYALWQIQEAVAKASGLNIVSDCFWQPNTRDLRLLYQAPGADKEAPPTALMVLKAATARLYPWRPSEASSMTDPFNTGWQWRGAGEFLTFRSLDREVWRAAFLPAKAVQTMDAWVEPLLPPPGVKKAPTVTPDRRVLGRLLTDLSVPQLRWGGLLNYGDPADYREACRQSLRRGLLSQVGGMGRLEALCLIGSLSEARWQELRTKGLVIGSELPLRAVQEAFRGRPGWTFPGVSSENARLFAGGGAGFAAGDVLRVRSGMTDKTEWDEPQPMVELEVLREGQRIARFVWETRLPLWPQPTESIALPSVADPPAARPGS